MSQNYEQKMYSAEQISPLVDQLEQLLTTTGLTTDEVCQTLDRLYMKAQTDADCKNLKGLAERVTQKLGINYYPPVDKLFKEELDKILAEKQNKSSI